MGKFVYLTCPTNPLKGPELSTLNLAWVQSSMLWQYFLYYANILNGTITKKKNDQTGTQANFAKTLFFGVSRPGMAHFILSILISCMHRTKGEDA